MNEETLNLSIRKFLKMVGVNSQREIEHAVASLGFLTRSIDDLVGRPVLVQHFLAVKR